MDSNRPGTRTRNRRGEGGLLRDEIVSAAAALLDETGDAGGVSLRAVARAAGIAAPSIYAHFPDREAVLLAVVQQEFAALHAHLQGRVDAAGPDVVDRLLALCDGYLGYAADHPQRYLVMFGGVWDARPAMDADVVDRADVTALGQETLRVLIGLLQDCVDEGRSTSGDPAADATAVWVALHGLAHQRIVSTAFPWPEGLDQRLVHRLCHL